MNNHTDNTVPDPELKELLTGYFKARERAPGRSACPGEEAFSDYLGKRLAPAAQQALEEHLCCCDTCLEAVIAGAALQKEQGPETITALPLAAVKKALSRIGAQDTQPLQALWKRLIAACDRLVNSLMEIIFFKEAETVYVRGTKRIISKNLVMIEKTFKEIKLEIEVEKIGEHTANIKVRAISPDTGRRVDGARVNILKDSREIASFMTAGGEALFENILFGEYTITVHQGDNKLGHLLLAVKES